MKDVLLTFGDIIWIDRTFNDDEISENHRFGPLIVLEQQDDIIYGIKGYGYNKEKNDSEYDSYNLYVNPIEKNNHMYLRKTTLFRTNFIEKMPSKYMQTYICRLSDTDIDKLKRKVTKNFQNIPKYGEMLHDKIVFSYKNGDIFYDDKSNNLYIVVDDSNSEYNIAIQYLYDPEDNKAIYNFDNVRMFTKSSSDYKYLKTLQKQIFRKYQDMYVAFKLSCNGIENSSKIIKQGSIITCNNRLYYVSTIEADKLLCYELIYNTSNYDISINENKFNINFKQFKFRINQKNMCYVCTLTEESIKEIRELKKSNKIAVRNQKSSDSKKLEKLSGSRHFGRIIHANAFPCVRFGAFQHINNHYIEVVDLDELCNGKFITKVFRVDQLNSFDQTHADFVNFIKNISVEIKDERYMEFLRANGIYSKDEIISSFTRKRKWKNDIN